MFNTLTGNIYLSECVAMCVCVEGAGTRGKNNPLISIKEGASDVSSARLWSREPRRPRRQGRPPFHSCGASAVGLKQTGSAHKDKSGDMYPLEPQSSAQICSIHKPVSLRARAYSQQLGGSLPEQRRVMYSIYLSSSAALFAFYNLDGAFSAFPATASSGRSV